MILRPSIDFDPAIELQGQPALLRLAVVRLVMALFAMLVVSGWANDGLAQEPGEGPDDRGEEAQLEGGDKPRPKLGPGRWVKEDFEHSSDGHTHGLGPGSRHTHRRPRGQRRDGFGPFKVGVKNAQDATHRHPNPEHFRHVHGPGSETNKGRGELTYAFTDFNRIVVSGIYNVRIRSGADYEVHVAGRIPALRQAHIEVTNNTLFVSHKKRHQGLNGQKRTVSSKRPLMAYISVPDLHEVRVSGVVEGLVENVDAKSFVLDVGGVGDLKVSGRCDHLRTRLSGVGELNARDLICKTADVSVSGVGDASIHATQSLDAHVSGIGDLNCYGSPKRVRKNKSFFSTIRIHK